MLEPGIRISHAAVVLAARVGCLLVWVGEAGVRLYASGQPGGARADKLLYQARVALDEEARLKWCARCIAAVSRRTHHRGARSISCVESKARACAKCINSLRKSSASSGKAGTTTDPSGMLPTFRTAACRRRRPVF